MPDAIAVLAYDATQILLRAIELANSSDPVKIKEAMQNMKDFPAITGKINFNQDGNPIKPVAVIQIKGGRQAYVYTVNP
ncbi:MAG: ABC transporter substrate-binding protein [Bacillota bacterium]